MITRADQISLTAKIGMLVMTKRREAQIDQATLGRRLSPPRTQGQISDIERGNRLDPYSVAYRRLLRQIALALGITDPITRKPNPRFFFQFDDPLPPGADIGKRLRYERLLKRGLTQQEAGQQIGDGISQETVSALERNPYYPASPKLVRDVEAWLAQET
jgi:hypothetical protein